MVALDDGAVVVGLAALDDLGHVAVDLKHPLLACNKFHSVKSFILYFNHNRYCHKSNVCCSHHLAPPQHGRAHSPEV